MRVQALYPIATVCVLVLSQAPAGSQPPSQMPVGKGQRLEALAWPEAEQVLTPETVVVLPVGAASKEHGPHLKLRNDLALADYLTGRVLDSSSVIVAPTLMYHYYPAFLEYPGSTSLTLNTARDMTAEVVRTLSAYGPRRFYVLNTGVSTVRALQPAAALLAAEGVLMRYTNLSLHLDRAAKGISEQEGGTHADEIETSMMLYIDPSSVDMSKAVKDYTPSTGTGLLNRRPGGTGTYSRTGIWGDPTRATREKDGSLSKRWLRESSTTSPLCDRPGCRLARPPQALQRNPRARLWRRRPPIQHQTVPTAARLETNAR